jgi:hypothetical protein
LKKNDTAALQAAVVVTGTASTDVSWSTSNSAIVEITAQTAASCTIKANTSGTAVITAASTFDGTKTAQYTVKAFEENAAAYMAEGGTITIIKNAAGDAYEEIHAFKTTGSADFKWKDGVTPAASGALLVVGAGGGSGGAGSYPNLRGKGGNGGTVIYNAAFVLPSGSTTVTVGAGGAGGVFNGTYGGTGGSSAFGATVTATGGTGGAGKQQSSAAGAAGMGAGSYTIETNTAKAYGAAGPSKSDIGAGTAGAANTGNGGQASYFADNGSGGGSGIVVVRFRYQ